MRAFPLDKVFQLLEPGPVVLLATSRNGRDNVMTMSWHMMMDFMPPRIACVVSEGDYSFRALRETGQCVLAIPTADMAALVTDIGNCSGARRDKFTDFGIGRGKAAKVAAPLIEGCVANIECRVSDDALVERYDLFVLEGVAAWADEAWPELASTAAPRRLPQTLHHNGDGTFRTDGAFIDQKARMVKFPEFL